MWRDVVGAAERRLRGRFRGRRTRAVRAACPCAEKPAARRGDAATRGPPLRRFPAWFGESTGTAASDRRPTVVIADDAVEVRALVRTRLRLSGKLDVVGEAANGVEAIEAVRVQPAALLLLDVSMPVMDGLGGAARGA